MKWGRGMVFLFLLSVLSFSSFAGDSVVVKPKVTYSGGFIHSIFFGKHYRKLWSTPLKMEVFDIGKEQGGLTPMKMGGSNQTTNLRLINEEGREFMLRLIIKDPTQSLSPAFKKKSLAKIIRDQNTAENPYGALIIPPLAYALGIRHAAPKLVYVPYDERLGKYNEKVANSIALFEERPTDIYPESFDLGHPLEVEGTSKMLKNVFENNDYSVDQKLFLKCRLFDMLISDWGRHEDQWRWALYDMGGKMVYEPIPRDRDHVFYLFDDGIITWMASKSFLSKFQSFNKSYKSVKGLNLSARFLDERFLNEMTLNDWLETAIYIEKTLTDSIIDNAVNSWPQEVIKIAGERTSENLKRRREKLVKAAYRSYNILAKDAIVYGSDSGEVFIINRCSDLKTIVTGFRKVGSIEFADTLYHREFNNKETKSIHIYGLGGNDVFIVEGATRKGIKVALVGGEGKDVYYDNSIKNGLWKRTLIVDSKDDSNLNLGPASKVMPSEKTVKCTFDREGYKGKKDN